MVLKAIQDSSIKKILKQNNVTQAVTDGKCYPVEGCRYTTICSVGASYGDFLSCAYGACVLRFSFFFSFLMNPCDAGLS